MDTSLPYASVVEEYSGTATAPSARYDYGDDLVRMDRGGVYYYLYDGLESTRQLINTSGTVTDTWGYSAFGELASHTGTTANLFLFNAQQFDQASGDYYLRARYYDQSNGRFISQDPFSGFDADTITLHRYLYSGVDPVNRVDPGGQDDLPATLEASEGEIEAEGEDGAESSIIEKQITGEIETPEAGDEDGAYSFGVTAFSNFLTSSVGRAFIVGVAGGFGTTVVASAFVGGGGATQDIIDPSVKISAKVAITIGKEIDDQSGGTPQNVYHYTNEDGYKAITGSGFINASEGHPIASGYIYPQGVYFTSIPPVVIASLNSRGKKDLKGYLFGTDPNYKTDRFDYFFGFNTSDLNVLPLPSTSLDYKGEYKPANWYHPGPNPVPISLSNNSGPVLPAPGSNE